jgi:hypothetical protein
MKKSNRGTRGSTHDGVTWVTVQSHWAAFAAISDFERANSDFVQWAKDKGYSSELTDTMEDDNGMHGTRFVCDWLCCARGTVEWV